LRQALAVTRRGALILSACGLMVACGTPPPAPQKLLETETGTAAPDYIIGPLDQLQVHVASAPELSVTVPVRPDGRISTPLVQDMPAAGKTPSQLARDLENALRPYIQQPDVSVVVQNFADTSAYTIRVMGAVANPKPVPYRPYMTVLDAMIAAGGLGQFAAGNRAVLIRGGRDRAQQVYRLRLDDLLTNADLSANAPVQPGDVIVVPESLL
jgi:polysaccharide export outer membrane protein